MTTSDLRYPHSPDSTAPFVLRRVESLVGVAVREAREVVSRLELMADSRIATPATISRRAAMNTIG